MKQSPLKSYPRPFFFFVQPSFASCWPSWRFPQICQKLAVFRSHILSSSAPWVFVLCSLCGLSSLPKVVHIAHRRVSPEIQGLHWFNRGSWNPGWLCPLDPEAAGAPQSPELPAEERELLSNRFCVSGILILGWRLIWKRPKARRWQGLV